MIVSEVVIGGLLTLVGDEEVVALAEDVSGATISV